MFKRRGVPEYKLTFTNIYKTTSCGALIEVGYHHGGHQRLVALAFSGSVGMTLLVLGCALPQP
ncbi:hypothetical protein V5799_000614, partial [Amblyomma americanum]